MKLVISSIWPTPEQRLKAVRNILKELGGAVVEND
jgi:hypothetical protein